MKETVKFEANVPQNVTLQYPAGKIVDSRYGGQQVMWGLMGERVMYLPLSVAERINQMAPKAGDSLSIVKMQSNNQTSWNIWYTQATEVARAHRGEQGNRLPPPDANESPVAQQMRGTLENLQEGRPAAAPRPQPVPASIARRLDSHPGASAGTPAPESATSKATCSSNGNTTLGNRSTDPLVDEANRLVDVYAAVLDRALTTYQGRIKPDEIKSIVLSCYISASKGGKYAAA